ncbi:MAG: DHCW motif cupin fold protein [Saprospiraceae bacterium]|nr:DHCW motif cupin fold protein [Saprospiraceae bacterium]
MDIHVPASEVISWDTMTAEQTEGETGYLSDRCVEKSAFRLRRIDFSDRYEAGQWCHKGHVIHVLSGHLSLMFANGTRQEVAAGQSCILGDNGPAHKAVTQLATTILVVE